MPGNQGRTGQGAQEPLSGTAKAQGELFEVTACNVSGSVHEIPANYIRFALSQTSPRCVLDQTGSAPSSRTSLEAYSPCTQRSSYESSPAASTAGARAEAAAAQLGIGLTRASLKLYALPTPHSGSAPLWPAQPSPAGISYDSEEDVFSSRDAPGRSQRSSQESTWETSHDNLAAALSASAQDKPQLWDQRHSEPGCAPTSAGFGASLAEPILRSFSCASAGALAPLLEDPQAATLSTVERQRSSFMQNVFDSDSEAAAQLFFRLNHARQTVEFVKTQRRHHLQHRHGPVSVWGALGALQHLREYETLLLAPSDPSLDGSLPLLPHALRTAEACRRAFPQHDWLHLVGLLHGLGKLLASPKYGSMPQWAVCGETFPVGCAYAATLPYARFFGANPDKRRRCYTSPCGMYPPQCGLASTLMSWSAAEYLHMVLARTQTCLPEAALFITRYQSFRALSRGSYTQLLDSRDRALLPLLGAFQDLSSFRKSAERAPLLAEVKAYYDGLISKYIPDGCLQF